MIPPALLTIFSSFYPLSVKLKCNVIQQNGSVTIQANKINQGTKFGMLCSVYLVWLFFDLMGKYNKIFGAQLPVNNIWNNCLPQIITFPQIITLFLYKKEIIAPGVYSWKYGIFEVKVYAIQSLNNATQ